MFIDGRKLNKSWIQNAVMKEYSFVQYGMYITHTHTECVLVCCLDNHLIERERVKVIPWNYSKSAPAAKWEVHGEGFPLYSLVRTHHSHTVTQQYNRLVLSAVSSSFIIMTSIAISLSMHMVSPPIFPFIWYPLFSFAFFSFK